MNIISKKTLLMSALALTSAFITSCSKDDDEGGSTPFTDRTELWAAASTDGKTWGYINRNGEMVIPAQYDAAENFSCGYGVVKINSKQYFIDANGNIKTTSSEVDDIPGDGFWNNYARVKKSGSYGLVDRNLNLVVQPIYYRLYNAGDNGLLAYKLSSSAKYGYLNTKGETVIQPAYDDAQEFVDGVAVVYVNGKYGAINSSGQYVINPTYDGLVSAFSNRIMFQKKDESSSFYSYGLLDLSGKVVVQPIYKSIDEDEYKSGLFCARNSQDKYGYIDANGNTKIDFKYSSATSFIDGYAAVTLVPNGREMIIDVNGSVVLTLAENEEFKEYRNGLMKIYDANGQISWRTKENKIIYQWKKY